MVIEEIKKGIQIPINIPTNTIGWPRDKVNASPKLRLTTAENAEMIASAAKAAAPIANPLPIAAVVFTS